MLKTIVKNKSHFNNQFHKDCFKTVQNPHLDFLFVSQTVNKNDLVVPIFQRSHICRVYMQRYLRVDF